MERSNPMTFGERATATEVLDQYELDRAQRAVAELVIEERARHAPFNAYTAAHNAGSAAQRQDAAFRAHLREAIPMLVADRPSDIDAPRLSGGAPMWSLLDREYEDRTLAIRLEKRGKTTMVCWRWHKDGHWNPFGRDERGTMEQFMEGVLLPDLAAEGTLRPDPQPDDAMPMP